MAEKCSQQFTSSSSVAPTKHFLNTVEIRIISQKSNNVETKNTSQSTKIYPDTLEDSTTAVARTSLSVILPDSKNNVCESSPFVVDDVVALKDNENESASPTTSSSEDITPSVDESTEQQQHHQLIEHENIGGGIYLETPVIDENNVCMSVVHEYENKKPKRISDDFFSSDDGDDGPSLVSSSCETSSIAAIANIQTDENSIENYLQASSGEFLEEDEEEENTNSSCSNLIDRLRSNDDEPEEIVKASSIVSENLVVAHSEKSNDGTVIVPHATTSSESTVTFYDNDVQSMDAIERRDFEHEQRLTGGVIIKSSSLVNSDNKLNLEFLKSYKDNSDSRRASSDSKIPSMNEGLCTTPTSSRPSSVRLTKSTAKLNLSATLDRLDKKKSSPESDDKQEMLPCSSRDTVNVKEASSSSSASATSSALPHCPRIAKFDMFLNSNSNDSLSSDRSYNTSSNHSLQNFFNKASTSNSEPSFYIASEEVDDNKARSSKANLEERVVREDNEYPEPMPSTSSSSHSTKCQYSNFCCEDSAKAATTIVQKETSNTLKGPKEVASNLAVFNDKKNTPSTSSSSTVPIRGTSREICSYSNDVLFPRSTATVSTQQPLRQVENRKFEEATIETTSSSHLPLAASEQIDNDFDDETWADCEEGSDEEICTCHNNDYPPGSSNATTEDDLPSRDVDLSGYIQMVSISEDMFLQDNFSPDLPLIQQRKRKLNESRQLDGENSFSESTNGRKRMAFDCVSTPRTSQQTPTVSSPSTPMERRTPRSLIPTKDNPPPELQDWLIQFQRWSHAERLLAVDRLIEHCEPTQVRHMMKVIEPQFQRDFISLLPKELALQVLSYLEPKDLLRAAQTCRSWRFLCDDNLLWKEKCRQAQIVAEPKTDRPKRGRAGNMPPISSPWKAAYMRQHIIEMNWRSRPIREPKILKGHDDHVITCLQFSGNRIVSGSDDNTLKVWSAVTGKCLRTLVGHTGGVWSSQMSGNIIISGSTDRTLKVWNMETGQCIHTLLGHTSTVRCMHLHGKKVVSGSRDATLRVWDIEQGTCLHVLVGHLAAVRCVQYDGKLIVSGAYDYMVKVWHPERQECLHTLQGHTNRVYSLQFDGIHVVSGSLDTSIRVWDAETGNCKHTLMGHQSLTSGMELRQNILVSGNADSTVKVWDITTGQCLQTLSGPNKHQSAVTCLQFNSRFVITSSDDGTVKLWDVRTGEFIRNLVALESGGSGGVVWRIRANDTKLICAVGSRNGTEETKLMVLDFDVEGACLKCS